MTFEEYKELAAKTALYPGRGENINYPTLGLVGEAGEIANVVKKVDRDDGGVLSDEKRDLLKKELGDVLWYISALSDELGFSIEDVAKANIEKLHGRLERGVLRGSGDNR